MLKALTFLFFFLAVGLDLATSMVLMIIGFVEQNPLYSLLGPGFWILYLAANTAVFLACAAASQKWPWAIYALWLPAITHLICGIHNLGLLF